MKLYRKSPILSLVSALLIGLFAVSPTSAQSQTSTPSANPTSANSILIVKAPSETIIWIGSLRYGVIPETGELTIKNLIAGAHTVRARLKGKREIRRKISLESGAESSVELDFPTPATKAELSFQIAEELREKGAHAEAIKEYLAAIKLNPKGFPAARIGLARSLMANEQYGRALTEARLAARENGGVFPEAYTVIANTKRTQGLYDDAILNYIKALDQARGFSPEAHTGIALAYQDRGLSEDAIKHLRLAVTQANDTEPIVYFLLGSALEREFLTKEAIDAYEKYLELDPKSNQAASLRSVLKQLRREIR
ncbi:MAG TPA: tetratricopeptide repeat protein [Blastocatellia bacterium]|nr:tetratricopeptide repeat protein [Blastocatellia bacterium]